MTDDRACRLFFNLYQPECFGWASCSAFTGGFLQFRRNPVVVEINQTIVVELVDFGTDRGTQTITAAATTIRTARKTNLSELIPLSSLFVRLSQGYNEHKIHFCKFLVSYWSPISLSKRYISGPPRLCQPITPLKSDS